MHHHNSSQYRRLKAAERETLTRVLATDFAIKQGKLDARTGVTMLVSSLLA